jgi:hypothetical protein
VNGKNGEPEARASEAETALRASIELITKVGTVIVVTLYVLGLLVTNIHLMGLGIADFSALQARFVLSGFLFLCYCALLFAGPTVFFGVPWACWRLLKSLPAAWRLALTFGLTSIVVCLVLLLSGGLLNDLYPWGTPYDLGWSRAFQLRESLRSTKLSVQMMPEAFFHTKILVGCLTACLTLANLLFARRMISRVSPNFNRKIFSGPRLAGIILSLICPSMFLILFGYAQSVFPNLPYNLGGGQPDLVQLYMREADLPFLSASGLAMEVGQGPPGESVPLALWHQDTSFLYVAPISTQSPGAARLTAIPVGSVAMVAYLVGYVKVTAGGQIQEAHLGPMARRP